MLLETMELLKNTKSSLKQHNKLQYQVSSYQNLTQQDVWKIHAICVKQVKVAWEIFS